MQWNIISFNLKQVVFLFRWNKRDYKYCTHVPNKVSDVFTWNTQLESASAFAQKYFIIFHICGRNVELRQPSTPWNHSWTLFRLQKASKMNKIAWFSCASSTRLAIFDWMWEEPGNEGGTIPQCTCSERPFEIYAPFSKREAGSILRRKCTGMMLKKATELWYCSCIKQSKYQES